MSLRRARRLIRRDSAIINALVVATLVIGIARMVALAGQW